MIWRAYQSVPSSDVTATTTSRRTPSTSCAYHSGNVSLSPAVISTPYGSTELSRSTAMLRVDLCPDRDAADQLVKSGTIASSATGDVSCHERAVLSPEPRACATPLASVSQTDTRPSAAQTPHAE